MIDVSVPDLEHIATMIGTAGVVPGTAARLVDTLPSLDDLEAALPRIPLPPAKRVLRFDLGSASWQQVTSATAPGAYRLEPSGALTCSARRRTSTRAPSRWPRSSSASTSLPGAPDARCSPTLPTSRSWPCRLVRTCQGSTGGRRCSAVAGPPMPDGSRRVLLYHHVPQRVADGLNSLLCS